MPYDLTNDPTYDLTNDLRRSSAVLSTSSSTYCVLCNRYRVGTRMTGKRPDVVGILLRMGRTQLPSTIEEFQARVDAATGGHATADDQSVTSDGRVLDTKEKVLAFLAELDEARQQNAAVGSP